MCKTLASSHEQILSFPGNGPTRRNLFGPVDREQLQWEYQEALRKDLEEASQRWGFNFFSEQPLEGSDFQWEAVTESKVPLFYRSSMVFQNIEKTPKKVHNNTLKRKQTNITDFYQAKRRVGETAFKSHE